VAGGMRLLTLIFTAFRDVVFAQCQLKRSNSENSFNATRKTEAAGM